MSSGFRGTVAEYQALYMEKNAHLEQFLEQVEPFDFYREIFPEGSFERKGHYEDSRPNGIAVSLPGKGGSVNGIALEEFHHIGASAARDGHSCFLRMCMIHKVMY